jgi:predicted lysophospholipase L1 biosynthesis ABC-type transport system permease subunit
MDDYYSQAYNLVWLATAVGIALCALGLVVALSDAVVRRRRTDAAAVAAGVPAATLRRALTLQTLLPAVPAILFGLALGGATAVAFTGRAVGGWLGEPAADEPLLPLPWGLWASWGVALIVAATLAALIASTALRRTTQPDQLRVPA